MAWRLAHSLEQLRSELNARWPNRDKSSDGAIGDMAHAATWSDHNPNSQGDVCALDVDTDLDGTNDSNDTEMDALVEHVRTHPHPTLKYVIFQGRMFSSYAAHGVAPFEWRPYTGDSHVSHPHFSVGQGLDGRSTPGTYDDTSPWLSTFETAPIPAPVQEDDDMPKQAIFTVAPPHPDGVSGVQVLGAHNYFEAVRLRNEEESAFWQGLVGPPQELHPRIWDQLVIYEPGHKA